jgi:hypothetical protein
MLRPN